MVERRYIDGRHGQLHIHQWGENTTKPILICLAPSPFSGKAYTTIAPLLAEYRRVIAIDYPGYGNSASTPHAPSIEDYADAVIDVIAAVSPDSIVDLAGFHTGCLVAVETSIAAPKQVNQLALIDVPFFSPEKQAELLPKMGQPIELQADLSMLETTWAFCVSNRLENIPLPRAFDMFVDHISAGVDANAAFNAAFQYPCEQRFKQVTQRTTVIATKAGLYEPSCVTATTIPDAKLIEHTEISTAVLEQGAPVIAATVNRILG